MCGFYFHKSNNLQKKNKLFINLIKEDLSRRGPDNFQYLIKKKVLIAFSRLSIIDLQKKSNQPFTDSEKNHYLIFNGEIYNFLELKKKLITEGYKFNTFSDTEVLYKLLKYKGLEETLKLIRGMFSFIFYDNKKNSFCGARDHFGQKPFYYYKNKKEFIGSTNIKSIFRNLKTSQKIISIKECKHYLCSNGIIKKNSTFFKSIAVLPAGYYFTYRNNKLNLKRYFSPISLFNKKDYITSKTSTENEVLEFLDQKIFDAVKKHSFSDARMAITCSGGIDSSLLVYYFKKIKKKIAVFTNVSNRLEKLSQIVPRIIKINNIKKNKLFFLKQKKKNYLNNLVSLVSESLSPARWGGGPPMKNLCQFARKKGYKILLGGDGVDEYFSGYNTFFSSLKNNSPYGLHKILVLKNKFNISNKEKKIFYQDIVKSKAKILKKLSFIKNKKEKKLLVNNFLDTEFFLQTCTLPHSDEYSMHESIEMRNVYLELDLVRFCLNLHAKFKISKFNKYKNKYLFRKLAIKKYGNFINKEKEGTRNYSKYISNPTFWNFNKFLIAKNIKIDNEISYQDIFKLINLEILQRSILSTITKESMKEILSPLGRKFLLN